MESRTCAYIAMHRATKTDAPVSCLVIAEVTACGRVCHEATHEAVSSERVDLYAYVLPSASR